MFEEIRERLRRGPPGPPEPRLGPEGAPMPPAPPKPPSLEEVVRNLSKPAIAASAALDSEVRKIMYEARHGNPVSREEAIETVASTEWAQNWADGMCRMAGLTPGTEEYKQCFDKLTTKVAKEVI